MPEDPSPSPLTDSEFKSVLNQTIDQISMADEMIRHLMENHEEVFKKDPQMTGFLLRWLQSQLAGEALKRQVMQRNPGVLDELEALKKETDN